MSDKDKDAVSRIDQLLGDVGNLSKPKDEAATEADEKTDSPVVDEKSGEEKDADKAKKDVDKASEDADKDKKEVDAPEEVEEGEQPSKKKLWWIVGSIALVLAVLVGAYAFLSRPLSDNAKNELYANGRYVEGISVFDVNVGGDTVASAREKLAGKVEYSPEQVLIQLRLKETIIPVKAGDLQINNTMNMVLNEAMLYGREGHFFQKIKDKSEAKKNGKNFDVTINTDEASLNTLVATIVEKYSIQPKDADVNLGTGSEKFTYTPEQVGMQIVPDGLAAKIKTHIDSNSTGVLDVDHTEVQPKITMAELQKNMVLRSAYTTKISGATGRRKNVEKAGSKINGKKVMPGENFNIEQELGPRTPQNGWNMGGEFVNGELVNGYGGGICQTSSTLFNAVIRADLEIIERSNHSQTVGYVPLGFDATISSGGPYFIWKNNTEYPLYIFSSGGTSTQTIEIYGAPLKYGDNITYDEKNSASGTITSGRRVESALVFYKDGKEVHRISWSSSYRGKPTKVTTTKDTTTAATTAPTKAPPATKPSSSAPKPTTKPSTEESKKPTESASKSEAKPKE